MSRIRLLTPLLLAACATAPQQVDNPTHTYGCTGKLSQVGLSYPNDNTALVTFESEGARTTHTLKRVESGNGVKYAKFAKRHDYAGNLIWWAKAKEGILYVTAKSASNPKYVYEQQLATCTLAYTQSE